jgi:hypothetical protein
VSLSGTLDSTYNIIYNVTTWVSINQGSNRDTYTNYHPWYRWDPATGTYPGL